MMDDMIDKLVSYVLNIVCVLGLLVVIIAVPMAIIEENENAPQCYDLDDIIEMTPFHATRVGVKYISTCGDTISTSWHKNGTIIHDGIEYSIGQYYENQFWK